MKVAARFDDISTEIMSHLRDARKSILICVAWINFDLYRAVLESAAAKGVNVEVLFADNAFNRTSSPVGVRTYRLRMRDKLALMHNKFCVVDGRVVITGSYNWSKMADRHFENIVIIEDSPRLAHAFLHEFEELKDYFLGYLGARKYECGVKRVVGGGLRTCSKDRFLVGVLGPERGAYDSSEVSLWQVCTAGHVSFSWEQNYQFLSSMLGLKDDPSADEDMEFGEDVERRVAHERDITQGVRLFLDSQDLGEVRAFGRVCADNWNEHIEWNMPLEYELVFMWRDPLYRKVIPRSFAEEAEYAKIYQFYLA